MIFRILFLFSVVVITTSGNQDANEVQDVAKQFAQRLKETREFGPEVKQLFVDRFVDCHLRAEIERKENGIFHQIRASIPPELVREARDEELRRYLIAQLNFFHLTTLYRMSTRDVEGKWHNSFFSAEQEYPPDVYELLMKNPAIAAAAVGENKDRVSISDSIRNVHQLRSVLPIVEQAMSAMRQYFMAHPPEETELYKKNMERIGNHKNYSKFWEVAFHKKISDKDAKEAKRCLGFSARVLTIVKVPPFYQLFVFQDGTRSKIGSLLCTEPPCID